MRDSFFTFESEHRLLTTVNFPIFNMVGFVYLKCLLSIRHRLASNINSSFFPLSDLILVKKCL